MTFKKGNVPWNTGKHLTKEHRQKLSISHMGQLGYWKGKHHSKEFRKKMSESRLGKKNPFYGRHHTEEAKKKLRLAQIGRPGYWAGKNRSGKTKQKLREANKGRISPNKGIPMKEETKQKLREANIGSKRPPRTEAYKKKISKAKMGHIVTEDTRNKIRMSKMDWDFYNGHGCLKRNYPYNDCFTEKFKDKIRALYGNKCVVTGMTNEEHKAKYGTSLHVHHWMYNKDETNPFYFVPVTCEINGMANKNKSGWIEMFNGIAEDKYYEMLGGKNG